MKFLEQKTSDSTGKFRFLRPVVFLQQAQNRIDDFFKMIASTGVFTWQKAKEKTRSGFSLIKRSLRKCSEQLELFRAQVIRLHNRICSLGVTATLSESDKRRLSLLNQINILHFITCLLIPFLALFRTHNIPFTSLLLTLTPAFVSALVLICNAFRRYNAALLSYFILYPFFTCLIYLDGMNLGMELYFIMYGILAVFFLKEISHMIFSVSFSMISYFMLAVVLNNYSFQLKTASPAFYFFNQLVAIILIFYGLYLIMKENAGYQAYILEKNKELEKVNLEVEQKNAIISDKAAQLEQQTVELTALNTFKTKLFSIISHDLRAPVYALKDLFNNAAEKNITPEEVRELIPDAANDLSFTAGLMENLLQWAKSQMQENEIKPQALNISDLVSEITKLYRLQADAKKVFIESRIKDPVYVFADKDMVSLILRNLLSNAIKFTPESGQISLEAHETHDAFVEICVRDNGMGMSSETLQKINENNFFTTKGTASESGTGLGLMLCKEFLAKNGGRMFVESKEGKGSLFSFTLPANS